MAEAPGCLRAGTGLLWEGLGLGIPRAGFSLVGVAVGLRGPGARAGLLVGGLGPAMAGCGAAVIPAGRPLPGAQGLSAVSACWGLWLQGSRSRRLGPVCRCLGWVPGSLVGPVLGCLWAQRVFKQPAFWLGGAVSPLSLLLGVRHASSGVGGLVVRSGSWCY